MWTSLHCILAISIINASNVCMFLYTCRVYNNHPTTNISFITFRKPRRYLLCNQFVFLFPVFVVRIEPFQNKVYVRAYECDDTENRQFITLQHIK